MNIQAIIKEVNSRPNLEHWELKRLPTLPYSLNFLNNYDRLSYTNNFILVFYKIENGEEFAYFQFAKSGDIEPLVWYKDTASNGDTQVKYRPLAKHKDEVISNHKYFLRVDKKVLEDINKEYRYDNMGHAIEHYLYNHFDVKEAYKPNNEGFYEGADITVNGVGYEIKSEHGALTREKTLKTAYKEQTGRELEL